jgi:hypothetical protein
MLKTLQYLWQLTYQRSPEVNLNALRRKLKAKFNNQEQPEGNTDNEAEVNTVVPDLWSQPIYQDFIAYKLRLSNSPIVLLGELEQINRLTAVLAKKNLDISCLAWNWDTEINLNDFSEESQLVVCKIPLNGSQWRVMQKLKERYLNRVTSIYELVLPLTMIPIAQSSLVYYMKSLEEISPYYLGEKYFGPIDKLNALFPLAGKTVIEFGPLDGCMTSGLVTLGVKKLTCIEARPENTIKTLIASYAFDWDMVELVMDDFHNVNCLNYGTYDLAFAHGVYYHSLAPFLFLENLCSLSSNIFMGGFCATDSLPGGDYELLEYEGEKYRVKMNQEIDYFTAGVNKVAYFFHKEDLMKFFRERNYEVIVISDEEVEISTGNYLRFLACKK